MGRLRNWAGETVHRLTVLYRVADKEPGRPQWFCKCLCGEFCTLSSHALAGGTQSCGCVQREYAQNRSRTHGRSHTAEYATWAGMKRRCYCETSEDFHHYGGRGITVCDRWFDSFQNFYEDIGPKPTPKHSIDRIDNNGNYEPSNCRWATQRDQVLNRRPRPLKDSDYLEYQGTRLPISEWAAKLRLRLETIKCRIRAGWTTEQIIETRKKCRPR